MAGPEQATILTEFEELYHSSDQPSQSYEQEFPRQETFQKQVTNMCDNEESIHRYIKGNHDPDTHDCVDDMVVQ